MGRLGEKRGSPLAESSGQGTTEQRGRAKRCAHRGKSLFNTLLLLLLVIGQRDVIRVIFSL